MFRPQTESFKNHDCFLGHVQNRKSIEEVIQFAADHKLLILANEVNES